MGGIAALYAQFCDEQDLSYVLKLDSATALQSNTLGAERRRDSLLFERGIGSGGTMAVPERLINADHSASSLSVLWSIHHLIDAVLFSMSGNCQLFWMRLSGRAIALCSVLN